MMLAISIGVMFSLMCMSVGNELHLDSLKMAANNTIKIPEQSSKQGSFASVSCICKGTTMKEDLPKEALKTEGHENLDFFQYCEKNNTAVCEFSTKCDNCTLAIKNCSRHSQREEISGECFYRSIEVQRRGPLLKTQIIGKSRHRRNLYPGTCIFPSEMRTAELKCHIYSKFVKCRQSCLYGYTLQEGISTETTCYYKDNKWSGHGFRECVPFVDCSITLASGGKVICEKNSVLKAPYCDVSCDPYEDKPSVPMKRYTCTLEAHKWKPDLPHCAIPGSGFILAPAPRIKDHSKEVFEPEAKRKKKPKRAMNSDVEQADDVMEYNWG